MSLTARLLLYAALAAVFTASVVQFSRRHIRLLSPPVYDDVSYFADAGERLVFLEQEKNLGAFVKHCISSPPHSPLATFLALAGFLVFGFKDWAPYAANGILVFAYIAMVDYLLRRRSLAVRAAMVALGLSLPWVSMLIYEFKPDPACALMVGFGVALALEEDLARATARRRCAVGAAFGLAILFKPSFFVFAAALVAATFSATLLVAGPSRFRDALKAWVWTVGAMVVVGGLPLALRPRYYFHYLKLGLTAPPLPPHPGGWLEQARYYLTGNPEYLMRLQQLALLSGALLISAAWLAYQRKWDRFRLVVAAMIPVTAAYLLPTLSPVKHPHFGVMFAVLLSFAVFRGLAEATGSYGSVVAMAVAVAGVWCAKPPPTWGSPSSAWVKQRWRLVDEVYGGIRERLHQPGTRIFVTAVGTVSPELLRFYAIRDGLPYPVARAEDIQGPEGIRSFIEWADLVIAPSPGAAEVWPYTPGARLSGESLAAVRADPSFSLFRTVKVDGGAYYLFEKILPFQGFRDTSGLQDVEGPYPQWGLGRVRWGLGPETTLGVEAEESGRFHLVLEARGAFAGLEVVLFLDGDVIARHTFHDPARFEKVEASVDLSAGRHLLKIAYSQWTQAPGEPPRAVLFRSIRLAAAQEPASLNLSTASGPSTLRR